MSQQLPQIKIADLLQYRAGMLVARILDVAVFQNVSKFANPPNSTVNVYKLKIGDETGTVSYSDWCKRPGVTRNYVVNQIIRFAHAKLKPAKMDANGQPYPPQVTA